MKLWNLPEAVAVSSRVSSAGPLGTALPAVDQLAVGFVRTIGRSDFGSTGLARINAVVAAASWSVYCLRDGHPPELHLSGSFGIEDTTMRCFQAYADGLYLHDATFDAASDCAAGDRTVMTHWFASEIGTAQSERIYRRHGMRERISLIGREDNGGLLAVNFYRHEHQRPFLDNDIHLLQCAAPIVVACVRKHVELAHGAASSQVTAPKCLSLRQAFPALTERELQVCDRLLLGMTYDGIAADLNLSTATVKTYRNRAFERLQIHFRSQLFALAMNSSQSH